ncbi:MAG: hypothetical protein ACLS69_03225 [Butyricicoccus sp.]
MSETLPSLTANGQKLIDRLLTLPQGWVTAVMLAESIGVSRRTVLRELPSVEQWIAAAGYRFVRSPGQGLLLDEPPARRSRRAAERHSLPGAAAPSAAAKAARRLLQA